jgi:predicted porin
MSRRLGESCKTAVIVAAALASEYAWAQSNVTIGGTFFMHWDTAEAKGGTLGPVGNIKRHDRVLDGFGSNIRFTVIEPLWEGTTAFVQVESSVLVNADSRTDAFGNGGGITNTGSTTAVWGNRNSGIGIRSKTAGRFLAGVWDVHYTMFYFAEGWTRTLANVGTSSLALIKDFGASSVINPGTGTRYSNVLRWDSPNWGGFSFEAAYARPTDGAPLNSRGDVRDGRRNVAWNLAPTYEAGPFRIRYSYLSDKDSVSNTPFGYAGVALAAGATISAAWKVTSSRLAIQYKFDNGIWIGSIWDSSTQANTTRVPGAGVAIRRTVWSFPLSYATGNHTVSLTHAKAGNWKGQVRGADVHAFTTGGFSLGADTGATFVSAMYAYSLSPRTAVYASAQKIMNKPLAKYDFFVMGAGMAGINTGADPSSLTLGIRHTF